MIVTWDTVRADGEHIFGGVEAGHVGSKLHEADGFTKVVRWVIRVPGDEDELPYNVMRRGPKSKTAVRSEHGYFVLLSDRCGKASHKRQRQRIDVETT